ncbi:LysM domain [Dillenia turbinata]|uniref:LysM domain n=1 Tax=Dillenia turbinata TaxID=194707 RepID=A0AAN8UP38_9MAGN
MDSVWVPLFLSLLSLLCFSSVSSLPTPLECTDTSRLCTSFLAFKPSKNQTLTILQSMFDVYPEDITVENESKEYVFVKKNCSCTTNKYLTNTTFTVRANGGSVYDMVVEAYGGLALVSNLIMNGEAKVGAVVSLRLFCGCSSGLWNYLMSYVMQDGDTIASLASRFGISMDSIESVNGIHDPDNVTAGDVYYIPLNSVPGETYPMDHSIPPAPVPGLSSDNVTESQEHHKSNLSYWWILGSLVVVLGLILVGVIICICLRLSSCFAEARGNRTKDPDGKSSHKFHVLRKTSFCCPSGRYICCKSGDWKQTNGERSNSLPNLPKVINTDIFNVEKPVVFTFEEIRTATDGFSDSNLLGHGTYGSVYYGALREQEVSIKRMTATKTKEFTSEMKLLCKVHHANLVELIGYAASEDELFLVYEYAQKGSLRSHLQDPQNKGNPKSSEKDTCVIIVLCKMLCHTTLSWIMRVQIALDAARGLEYIHEHTKNHYVHRDIKTSNILLDGAFRAKVSDFGLAKLVGKTNDGEASTTRVVGTFGYLAPEYLRDGLATAKSDVYAFGVVLFELISGKEAITRTDGMVMKNSERRSLASIMLAVLRNVPDSTSMSNMKDCIDLNLMDLYPHDCVYKVAMLAKQCVDDDPILRPDMKQVVISLSQILLSSVEWEATLAGNSQVFSGLVQGR